MKNDGIYLLWAIRDSLCVSCWVALAMVFDKWWIALFGLLCISNLKTYPAYFRICDGCGKHSEISESIDGALEKAKAAGWFHYENGKDYCPDCQ